MCDLYSRAGFCCVLITEINLIKTPEVGFQWHGDKTCLNDFVKWRGLFSGRQGTEMKCTRDFNWRTPSIYIKFCSGFIMTHNDVYLVLFGDLSSAEMEREGGSAGTTICFPGISGN